MSVLMARAVKCCRLTESAYTYAITFSRIGHAGHFADVGLLPIALRSNASFRLPAGTPQHA